MPIHHGLPELLIILVVVILLFGASRIGKIARELGSGIRAFKNGLKPNEKMFLSQETKLSICSLCSIPYPLWENQANVLITHAVINFKCHFC